MPPRRAPTANGRTSARGPRFPPTARWSARTPSAAITARRSISPSPPARISSRRSGSPRTRAGRRRRGAGRLAEVPNARAYFMMAMGAAEDRTMILWTSSEVQFSQIGLMRLSAPRTISPACSSSACCSRPPTTQCTVPAEVAGRVQAASLMLNAFGPEANFSHPARPARPAARLGARLDGEAAHPLGLYGHARPWTWRR